MSATATRKRAQAVPEGLTRAEFDRLMDPKTIGNKRASTYARDRMLLVLLAGTGLRINEALTLERSQLDLDAPEPERPSVWIPAAKSKTKRGRPVTIGPTLRDQIAAYVAQLPPGQSFLFVTRTGKPMSDAHARRLFKKAAARAGLDPERIHPHVLRHTWACRALAKGCTLASVRDQLGHADIKTTSIYLRAASWQRADEISRLDL